VFFGADAIAPLQFLSTLALAYETLRERGLPPETIKLGQLLKLAPESHVAADTPGLFGGWVIHKENFRAPKILEVARLQAWTLKPAIRAVAD
jgi:hypothetical protein